MKQLPFPFQVMETKPDALDRLDIQFQWGNYGIRVLRCHLLSFQPGRIISFHHHSEYEFHFIPRGKGMVIMKDQPYELQEGMFYLTGPQVEHYQEADQNEAMDELCLHIDVVKLFEKEVVPEQYWGNRSEIFEADACIRKLDLLPLYPTSDRYHAMQWFLTAYQAWSGKNLGYYSTIHQAVIQILLRSVRNYEVDETPFEFPTRDMSMHRYLLATQFIVDNYSRPISLEDVADKISVSGRQLQRIFLEHAGLSFSKYLEDLRISHVCHDLVNSKASVQQIALQHGFANSNYLFYVFRKRFEMTPNQYRMSRIQI
ncbi:MAG: AraC-type DNA-binding protein [Bacilli bacterium]|nr:AraC-type DNA-binding protein [Bacilli bacterium]